MKKLFLLIIIFSALNAGAQLPSERPAGKMYTTRLEKKPVKASVDQGTPKQLPSEAKLPKQATESAAKSKKKAVPESDADKKKKLQSNKKQPVPVIRPPKMV